MDQAKPRRARARAVGCTTTSVRLTLTYPQAGVNEPLTRILIALHDMTRGWSWTASRWIADFPIADVPLAKTWRSSSGEQRWRLGTGADHAAGQPRKPN